MIKVQDAEDITMCGRFTLYTNIDHILDYYEIENPVDFDFHPRYNIAPTQWILAIINDGKKNVAGYLRWGLIPSWAKDDKKASWMINARAETLLEKPSFRQLIQRKRCIIPIDGFYEWKQTSKGKQPMRILMKNQSLFSIAGLYDTWIAPDGTKISTCTIITTKPNRLVETIHDRMPVILRKEDQRLWLDRRHDNIADILALLKPYEEAEMTAYPVPYIVGNVRNDSPECINSLVE